MPEEFEAKLRVSSPDPEAVFREIEAQESFGEFRLFYENSRVICDHYLDTKGQDLRKKKSALRIRTGGPCPLICYKADEMIDEKGCICRTEIEGTWSKELLERIDSESGLNLLKNLSASDAPLSALIANGFIVIQSRETLRKTLAILAENDIEPMGELALDRVCYEVKNAKFLHYEIEAEAKGEKGRHSLPEFVSALCNAFPGVLLRWDHNKLITGFALEEILSLHTEALDPDTNGIIPEEWYTRMDELIRKGRLSLK